MENTTGENMLSEEEIKIKMDNLADEYMKREIPNADYKQFENLNIAYSYIQIKNLVKFSENLVRSTNKLQCWTIVLVVFTLILGVATIADIFS